MRRTIREYEIELENSDLTMQTLKKKVMRAQLIIRKSKAKAEKSVDLKQKTVTIDLRQKTEPQMHHSPQMH